MLSCQEQCDVREYARVYRGKIELWDPKMLIKAGKAAKIELFGHRELKLFCGTRKLVFFGSHRAKILL